MKALFGGSEVRGLLGMDRPLASCSSEAHAVPQVAEMFAPSLYTGASLHICECLLKRTTFWASYSPHIYLLELMK